MQKIGETKPQSIFLDGRSWPLFHAIASLFLAVVFVVHWTGIDAFFDTRISAPILFQVRESLGYSTPLNPRVKVLALDDNTFSYLGGPRLNFQQMHMLLQNLASKKPKAILIDALLADTSFSKDEVAMPPINAPVYSGSFLTPNALQYRTPADLTPDIYKTSTYLNNVYSMDHLKYKLDSHEGWFVYGRSPAYNNLIKAAGHITFNRDRTISPFFRIDDNTVIPHLSLFAADSIKFEEKHLIINDHEVPLTKSGRLMINHRKPDYFYKRALSLRPFIQRAMNHEAENSVDEGDVVVILLAFATGNTDFHEGGPFGDIPGGLIITSMVSDILDGHWLTKWETDGLLIVCFGFLGIAAGINLSIRPYLAALIGTWVIYTAFVFVLFVKGSIWCPWALPMVAFTGTSLIHFFHKRIYEEMKLMLIERNYQMERARRLQELSHAHRQGPRKSSVKKSKPG